MSGKNTRNTRNRKKMSFRKRGAFLSVLGMNGMATSDGIIVDQASFA